MSPPNPHMLTAADAIADRLADPHAVRTDGDDRCRPQSLANGAAGIALLHIERARARQVGWATAHGWLSAAASEGLSAGPGASLFLGVPALAFVVHAAADRPGKLERALADLDASTVALTRRRLDHARARIDRGDRPALAEFDLIRGLTGLGAYHLHRHPDHDVTRAVLTYLVRLTEPLPHRTDDLPGWWTDLAPTGRPSPEYPGGHGNFGMAHGIAGPLALLSLAMRRTIVVDGHAEAIGWICAWLDAWRQEHLRGPWWPRVITPDEVRTGRPACPRPLQPSWCYGTPGLARSQQLAGLATGDLSRQRMAENALLGCLDDPVQLKRLVDSGLCHGMAGLFQTAWRMASEAHSPDIAAHLPQLSALLVTQPQPPFDKVGFLEGATGVALALHTAGTGGRPLTHWDTCLLLG